MHLLFPGRHHLQTQFQHDYLCELVAAAAPKIDSVIFAVTSANHSHTRRNPFPLHLRAMALHEFGNSLPVESFIYDIDDVGELDEFASYVLRRISVRSAQRFVLTPENTVVLCSTPSVIALYEDLGFQILPAELADLDSNRAQYTTTLPWEVVEQAAAGDDAIVSEKAHASTVRLWQRYGLTQLVRGLFNDALIGDDGDLTDTRDYNAYVRQMDENIPMKYAETAPFLRPGRIGDIGCAVGSWIRQAAADPAFSESEFYGVEVSRQLFTLCEQRKSNGDFANPFVFFSRKNAVEGRVFEEASMHSIHTSSLTHEIYSYVPADSTHPHEDGLRQLRSFIANRAAELLPGGVWINRDVVGPEDGDRLVLLETSDVPLFKKFAREYRRAAGETVSFEEEITESGATRFRLGLADAWEFATKKDYTENWHSEMHERFCFWSASDWRREVEALGLRVLRGTHCFTNEWIVENRLRGQIALFDAASGVPLDYPPTTMVLVAERPQ